MTDDRELLAEVLAACERPHAHLGRYIDDVEALGVIDGDSVANLSFEEETSVRAFLKTFEQFQDMAARRLLRLYLVIMGEDVRGLTARDAFDRAETVGVLDSADAFFEVQRVRNKLAHEYPMDNQRRARRINEAHSAATTLLDEYQILAAKARELLGEET